MKRLGAIALVFVVACATPPTADEKLREQLVGKWGEAHHFATLHMEQSFELSNDGTSRIERAVHDASGTNRMSLRGRWRIENGDFVLMEEGGRPETECRYRIVSVSEWELVWKDSSDNEFRAWRYPK